MARKKKSKISKVLTEFHSGSLHHGSKNGPIVKNKKVALAIALSEARKAGENIKPMVEKPFKKKKKKNKY